MKLRVLEGTSLSHCARASGWTFATNCHVCSTSTGRLATFRFYCRSNRCYALKITCKPRWERPNGYSIELSLGQDIGDDLTSVDVQPLATGDLQGLRLQSQ